MASLFTARGWSISRVPPGKPSERASLEELTVALDDEEDWTVNEYLMVGAFVPVRSAASGTPTFTVPQTLRPSNRYTAFQDDQALMDLTFTGKSTLAGWGARIVLCLQEGVCGIIAPKSLGLRAVDTRYEILIMKYSSDKRQCAPFVSSGSFSDFVSSNAGASWSFNGMSGESLQNYGAEVRMGNDVCEGGSSFWGREKSSVVP